MVLFLEIYLCNFLQRQGMRADMRNEIVFIAHSKSFIIAQQTSATFSSEKYLYTNHFIVFLIISGPQAALNTHDSVMKITAWAQEYFQKPLFANTVCRAIHRCRLKLFPAKNKLYVNMTQKHCRLLWVELDRGKVENCSVVRQFKNFLWKSWTVHPPD